ncbi:MAG: hypothetical protein V4654_06960 [Bdellovibrionota bacterium]
MLRFFKLSVITLLTAYSQYSSALGACGSSNVGAVGSASVTVGYDAPSCGGNKSVPATQETTTYYRCESNAGATGVIGSVGWVPQYSVTQYNIPLDVDCPN